MTRRKLIAIDIDGTLLNSEGEILASTLETITKLKSAGHFVTLATGRSLPTTREIIEQVNFEHYILCNGSYAFVNHQKVYSNPLDKTELKELALLAEAEKIDILYQTMEEVKQQGHFIHHKNRELQAKFSSIPIVRDFSLATEKDVIYQAILFCNREEAKIFHNRFDKIRFTRWGEVAMDAIPMGGSKAHTLSLIAKDNGFIPEDVVVFGDGENDIEMLNYAGLGIVMDNALDVVKQHGDFITKSHNHDGIWHAAKHHRLI